MNNLEISQRVAQLLGQARQRIVFAESCTAGLVSASLATVPGISNWLCGSAVTYREETKIAWLGVNQATLEEHTAVSSQVTAEMAEKVLDRTPEADIACAITGHLGPDAPKELDGKVFIAIAARGVMKIVATGTQLQATTRQERQEEAVEQALQGVEAFLNARRRKA